MQTCTVEVFLGGDRGNSAILQEVTPAEVLILQRIHGPLSVEFRGERDEGKHNHADEIERLKEKYLTSDPNIVGAKIRVFDSVFPGSSPRLPLRFADIGFGDKPAEVRVMPDKPGFHGDTGSAPQPEPEQDDWEEEEEEETLPPAAEGEAPKKNKGGRPRKQPAATE